MMHRQDVPAAADVSARGGRHTRVALPGRHGPCADCSGAEPTPLRDGWIRLHPEGRARSRLDAGRQRRGLRSDADTRAAGAVSRSGSSGLAHLEPKQRATEREPCPAKCTVLSGVRAKRTEGADYGPARRWIRLRRRNIGGDTPLPSLELDVSRTSCRQLRQRIRVRVLECALVADRTTPLPARRIPAWCSNACSATAERAAERRAELQRTPASWIGP